MTEADQEGEGSEGVDSEDARRVGEDDVQEARALPVQEHGIDDDETFVQVSC